jgi:cobalt-zinc-cadmium efflux system outer membrane protein
MRIRNLVLSFSIGAAACAAKSQQSMPDMPGMNMNPQQSLPQPKPDSPQPVPQGMMGSQEDKGSRKAAAAGQQHPAQEHGRSNADSDADSMHIPFQQLQEPEAIEFRTGTDLPAPDLLSKALNQESMSIEDFIALAEKNNPTLAQAQRNVDRSNEQGRQAGLPPNPVIGYSGDHIRGGSYHGGEQGAFFSQELLLGDKLALRRDIFAAQARSNQFFVEAQRARIHSDVARAFFDALTAQESVTIHDRLLKVALDVATNSHELERVGQADASDVLNAEVSAEQAKVEFVTAQRTFLASFGRLASVAGQLALPAHVLAGRLEEPPEIDAEAMVAADTRESPAVRQAQAKIAVAEALLKSANREKIPNLSIKVGEWYSGEDLGATTKKAGFESFAEAGLQIPLWNRNQGNIEAAKMERERTRQDVTRTQLAIRTRAEPLAQQYQTARYTVEKYRNEILPRARRAYELEVTKYQQMAQTYSHVLTAQHMLFTMQLIYLRALNEEWRTAIALQNYTLSNSLDEPAGIGQNSSTLDLPTTSGGMN